MDFCHDVSEVTIPIPSPPMIQLYQIIREIGRCPSPPEPHDLAFF